MSCNQKILRTKRALFACCQKSVFVWIFRRFLFVLLAGAQIFMLHSYLSGKSSMFIVKHQVQNVFCTEPPLLSLVAKDGISELALSNINTSLPAMRDRCTALPPFPSSFWKIPFIVHFIFGMSEDFGGRPFGFLQYVAFKSARERMRRSQIYLHYTYRPAEGTNKWWDLLLSENLVDRFIRVDPVTEIFGIPVADVSHRADVLRLQILKQYGGIYLDTDVITINSFEPLLHHEFVLGQESWGRLNGLANAIIVSSRDSKFLHRWYDEYRTFNDSVWNYHSVMLPMQLAKNYSSEICVMHPLAFFYPAYFEYHINFVHHDNQWDFDNSFQYAYHAYSHSYYKLHDNENFDKLRAKNTSFGRLVAKYIPDDV